MIQKTEKFGSTIETMVKNASRQATIHTPKETQLQEGRDAQQLAATSEGTLESRLGEARTGEVEQQPYEVLMAEHRKKAAAATPNANMAVGTTEARLNQAEKGLYPHRNPEACERTGQKRPVNSLPEEAGEASDDSKRKRYEKAMAGQKATKRVVDKDQGSQLPFKPFNSRKNRVASLKPYNGYLAYRAAESGGNESFKEVAELDSAIRKVITAAATDDRWLTKEEQVSIEAMKRRKAVILGK